MADQASTGGLTVAVDVHGAGIALPVAVGVDLCGVVHVGAVVAAVPNLVFVVVKLTGVEEKLAVVLEENAREEPDAPRGAGMSAIGLKRLSTGSTGSVRSRSGSPRPTRKTAGWRLPIKPSGSISAPAKHPGGLQKG